MVASNSNSAVTKNDKVLFYSYMTYSLMESNKFDIYNWQTNTWSIGVLPPNLVPPDKSRVMAVSGQDVYIVIGNKLYKMNI